MAGSPFKVAPRTMFEAERTKAENKFKRILKVVTDKIKRGISKAKTPEEITRFLNALKGSKEFKKLCDSMAKRIVTMLAVGQRSSWRIAASESSQGRRIFKALQKELKTMPRGKVVEQIIEENSKLIQTVPQNLAERFSKMAASNQFAGKRPEELVEVMQKMAPELTDTQARRIARTESGKAATALIQARAEDLGLRFYVWKTCQDARVRTSHEIMNNVVCSWDDPPNPEALRHEKSYGAYHPHGIFNCRCEALPVVDKLDLKFPLKAHKDGKIVTVSSQKSFNELFGIKDSENKRRNTL